MVRIFKKFTFEAAHQLIGYDGGCANVHGHSYKLVVGLKGETIVDGPNSGFLLDFRELKAKVKRLFLDDWDHSFLAEGNEPVLQALQASGSSVTLLGFRPTAENMCCHILKLLLEDDLPVESVKLWETATSWAEAQVEDFDFSENQIAQEADLSLTLPVSELFGPTIQGEGLEIGRKSLFLRLYGCDDRCAWCDTAYAWDGRESPKEMTLQTVFEGILERSEATGCRHVTITGGNPCIHNTPMRALLLHLREAGFQLSLETQGTAIPDWLGLLNCVTISPKPPSSGNATAEEQVLRFIGALEPLPYSVKIVIFDDKDLEYAKEVFHGLPQGCCGCFLQPCHSGGNLEDGIRAYEELCRKVLADPALDNVRILPQLHTWVWGNEREV